MNSLGPGFDTLLTRGALGALAGVGGWALLVVLSVALEARTGGRVRLADRTGCPAALRRWLLGLFLAGVAGVTVPAAASASDSGAGPGAGPGAAVGPDPDAAVAIALDGLPLPDRFDGAPRRAPGAGHTVVVVRRGDSLWRIAARVRPDETPDAEIAAAVARLYAANHQVIGADPDLIVPGQRLRVGSPTTRPTTSTPLSEDR